MYEYNFGSCKNCPYRKTCNKVDTEECNDMCIRFSEIDSLFRLSNIPKNRQQPFKLIPENCDIPVFDELMNIKADIENKVKNGLQLYIYSSHSGNGKTSWAIKLMQSYFDCVWPRNGFRRRGLFVNVPTFLRRLKKNFDNPEPEIRSMLDDLDSVDMVIWDDISGVKLSEYDYNLLVGIIESRILEGKCNIYTGRAAGAQLKTIVGSVISNRMEKSSRIIKLNGLTDRRLTE